VHSELYSAHQFLTSSLIAKEFLKNYTTEP